MSPQIAEMRLWGFCVLSGGDEQSYVFHISCARLFVAKLLDDVRDRAADHDFDQRIKKKENHVFCWKSSFVYDAARTVQSGRCQALICCGKLETVFKQWSDSEWRFVFWICIFAACRHVSGL